MTVFTAEVAARRTSGFTIDSLIGKDKESNASDKSTRTKHSVDSTRQSGSPGPRVHRPTPLVSSTIVRPKADCSPCSALNLSLSGGPSPQQDRTLLLANKTNCDTSPTENGGPVFGLNYLDAVNHPLLVRRGLQLNAQPNPQLWAHYSPELHRNLSMNGPLFGRSTHLRPPLPFAPGAGVMPFHPALISPHRDFFHPYHWNVRHQDSLPLPHLAGPGAGLFFHAFRKPKRHRTAFSPAQLLKLEHAFDRNQYVVGQERKALAEDLNLSETQVKVWFQNRRTKFKRVKSEGDTDEMDESPTHEADCAIDEKVSHHVTRWKRETNQVEVVDSDIDDDSDCPEPLDDKDV